MTSVVNTAQAQAWNGYEGEHWAAHYDRYDAVNGGFNEALFDAARLGEHARVLDVGCGNGQMTRAAARRAPLGQVTGVDLSEPMLARARDRADVEKVANVSFQQGDVQVYPFRDGSFDIALSRFGAMFFADPVAAFANIGRALRPGGRLAFVCMTELSGTDLGTVLDAMAPHLPRPTGPDGTGPTSFADPARTRSVLSDAGFRDIACTRVEADQIWGRDVDDAAEFIGGWGPVKHHLDQVAPDDAARAVDALTVALRPFAEETAVRLRGTAWLVTALR
ncbi:SAM-dependent methyltransferase [Actinoalloteichus hoggarensis]|uniref:Malonyl-[acyl-carrier protein] O-methyltransferase n=1 Tax=Actinoalloteichus hoggarensis TaxID=1470176 RepID=A0A221WAW9_9PSEU|nr:class I SAM-dependent methyltransferase [Actinoalloteichus hoggarensis]ASO23140.1 Malonyl-[acyl-carrier protein] O-methyltransferase [Actinoalloteichus hoggarensis]MBB5922744.1 SAM-dependent methyltransferase [Actinoalloteichus hoggarensis]